MSVIYALANSFLAGELNARKIVDRATQTLGNHWKWLDPLALRLVAAFESRTRPRLRDVVRFLEQDRGFRRARRRSWNRNKHQLTVASWFTEPQQMQPVTAAVTWEIPPIESIGALADWLALHLHELDWFADLHDFNHCKNLEALRNYRYRILAKHSGSVRLIEAPKPRLKEVQRRILTEILDKIPPHPSAHGFLKERSIRTFVAPHVNQRVILRMDLRDYFPSLTAGRIQTFFRTLGYPETVADLLGGLCTNAAPRVVWRGLSPAITQEVRDMYARPHLPQGAPTSPALANLCTYRVDCRLTGLAESAGAVYTRYADDLAFSGSDDFDRSVDRFSTHVAAILMEEGFMVHHRKTRVMRQGVRQHLAGLVANEHVNVMRPDFDRLKAILTNCVRQGPESQNREEHTAFRSHLEGRVAFVESVNPAKAQRLRALFNQIQWP